MVRLLAGDHMDDQLAALTWLRGAPFVDPAGERHPLPRSGSLTRSRSSRLAADLLRQVVLQPDLIDEGELRLEPVGVLLLAGQDVDHELEGAVVAERAHRLDAVVQELDGAALEVEVQVELLLYRLADVDLAESLEVRHALEIEDARDEAVGVLHLVDRLGPHLVGQPLVAPVGAHAGVDEVLVDRGELVGEELVQDLQDLRVTFHAGRNATGIRRPGQSAHRPLSRAHSAAPAASSISWIIGRHAPHPVPAPHASPTASTVRAPAAMDALTSLSLAALQRQTYTVRIESNI